MRCKKWIAAFLCGAVLSAVLTAGASAAGASLLVNRQRYPGNLYVQDGHICVPLRSFCESLGYTVEWDAGSYSAVVSRNNTKTVFPCCGDSFLYRSSMYTPVRSLTAALGGQVEWDAAASAAKVTLPGYGNTDDDLYWLSRIIQAEAGAESMEGKIAVANTILARVASDEFPDTIYGVIFDDKYGVQYEPVSNGTVWNTPDSESYEAARRALNGEKAVENCLYFFNPAIAASNWIAENRSYVTTIGNHDFYA